MANDNPRARLAELRERWDSDRSSRLFLQLAEEYRRLGQPEEALEVLAEGLKNHPATGAVQVVLGRCQLETGDHDAAVETLEQVVRRDPTQMVAYRALVEAYLQQRSAGKARERLGLYAQLNPQDPEIEELSERIDRLDVALEPDQASEVTPPEPEESSEDDSARASNEVLPPDPPAAEDLLDPGATVQVPTPSLDDLTPPPAPAPDLSELPSMGVEEPISEESLVDDLIARAGQEPEDAVAPPAPPELPEPPLADPLSDTAEMPAMAAPIPDFPEADPSEDSVDAADEEPPVITAPVPVSDLPEPPAGLETASENESDEEAEPLSLPDVIAAQAASFSAAPKVPADEPAAELETPDEESVADVASAHLDLSEPGIGDVEVEEEPLSEEPEVLATEPMEAEEPEHDADEDRETSADELAAPVPDLHLGEADGEDLAEDPADLELSSELAEPASDDEEDGETFAASEAGDLAEEDLAGEDLDDEELADEELADETKDEWAGAPEAEASEQSASSLADDSEEAADEDSSSSQSGMAAAAGFVGSLGLGWVATREGDSDSPDQSEVEEPSTETEEPESHDVAASVDEQVESAVEIEEPEEAPSPLVAEPSNGVVFQLDASRLPPRANLEVIPPRPLRRPRALQPPVAAPVATAPQDHSEPEETAEPEETVGCEETVEPELEAAVSEVEEPAEPSVSLGDTGLAGAAAAGATATLANLYREQGHTEEAARVMSSLRDTEPPPQLTAADLLDTEAEAAGLSGRKSTMLKNYLDRLKGGPDVS